MSLKKNIIYFLINKIIMQKLNKVDLNDFIAFLMQIRKTDRIVTITEKIDPKDIRNCTYFIDIKWR